MTQLVQLQQILPALRAAGYEPFAVSNDTVDRLAEFSTRYHITYPLLSDEDSAVIRAFGILNTLIEPGEGKHMRWYGIPYPGSYVTDAAGVVIDKDFHQHHARRLSGQALLHRLLGTVPEPHDGIAATTTAGEAVALTAYLADPTLRLEVISTLVCRLEIAPGLHLYADGAPEAFTAVSLEVVGHGIRVGEPRWPEPHQLEMAELGLLVPVHEGTAVVTVPITVTSEVVRLGHGLDQPAVEVVVRLRHQACDDTSCGLPTTIETTLTVPLQELVEPDGIKVYVERLAPDASAANPGGPV